VIELLVPWLEMGDLAPLGRSCTESSTRMLGEHEDRREGRYRVLNKPGNQSGPVR